MKPHPLHLNRVTNYLLVAAILLPLSRLPLPISSGFSRHGHHVQPHQRIQQVDSRPANRERATI